VKNSSHISSLESAYAVEFQASKQIHPTNDEAIDLGRLELLQVAIALQNNLLHLWVVA
jgi:hypothetical protein